MDRISSIHESARLKERPVVPVKKKQHYDSNKGSSLDSMPAGDAVPNSTASECVNINKRESVSLNSLLLSESEQKGASVSKDRRVSDAKSFTSSHQAAPPGDDSDDYKYVPSKTSPISIIDDNLDGGSIFSWKEPTGSSKLFATTAAVTELLLEVPTTPIETLPEDDWRYSSQSSVRIEPSPERTLEMPKRQKPQPAFLPPPSSQPQSSKSADEDEDSMGVVQRKRSIHVSKSANSLTDLIEPTPVRNSQVEIVNKLNNFFGEARPGVTQLETSIYKTLVCGPTVPARRQEINDAAGVVATTAKVKKASAAFLASKLTNLYPSTNQLKMSSKKTGASSISVADRDAAVSTVSLAKSKSHKTWRGKMSRTFRKYVATTTSSELLEDSNGGGGAVATFGVPLEVCPTSSSAELVPLIVEVCVNIVEELGINSQGIYRIPGHTAGVNELVEEVNRGDPDRPACISVENERWNDVNVVASLLKLFFRKLPEALTTNHLYEPLISAIRSTGNPEKSSLRLKRLLHELPEQNFTTLRYLIRHLANVAGNQAVNKMDSHNLAIMFGPSLVRPTEESMTNMVRDIDDQGAVIGRLIQNYQWYFGEWTAEANVPCDVQNSETTTNSSSGPNLQLLANAESLVAMQLANDALGASTADDVPSFFHLGSHRQSRKNKNKIDKDSNDISGPKDIVLPDLNREVVLRRERRLTSTDSANAIPAVNSQNVIEVKSKDTPLLGLTSVDLARKVSMSAKNKKIKRRYTERPNAKNIAIAFDKEMGPKASERSVGHGGDSDIAVPPQNKEQPGSERGGGGGGVGGEPILEIKRYPAYNFVDTTITLTNSASFKQSSDDASSTPRYLSSTLSSTSLRLATVQRETSVVPIKETIESIEDWPSSPLSPEDNSDSNADVVFHSADAVDWAKPVAFGEYRYQTMGPSHNRSKRFSETDASRYAVSSEADFDAGSGIKNGAYNITQNIADDELANPQDMMTHKYDVVIRTPEGRRYYVLSTNRPSVFFDKSRRDISASTIARRNKLNVGRQQNALDKDRVMMMRVDRAWMRLGGEEGRGRGSEGGEERKGRGSSSSCDDIELRRYVVPPPPPCSTDVSDNNRLSAASNYSTAV